MNAPDVLAVMKRDRLAATLYAPTAEYSRDDLQASHEAAAAVAELVEAGKFLATNPLGMITPGALNRWNAALARCGGAK